MTTKHIIHTLPGMVWQDLSHAQEVFFLLPDYIKPQAHAAANYRGYRLVIGGSSDTTFITLANINFGRGYALLSKKLRSATIILDIETLLTPPQFTDIKSSQIIVEVIGQTLLYRQPGTVGQLAFLQFLVDWLSDLADAYPHIVALGGQAVPTLQTITLTDYQVSRRFAQQLLTEIERETRLRLSYLAPELICSDCIIRCVEHKMRLSALDIMTYYGCRFCLQSRSFWQIERITALLNANMTARDRQHNKAIWVNWLIHRKLFDFSSVEIIQATDEDVERFVVQVGNDTDPIRISTYKQMKCTVSSQCTLSPNTQRILTRTFGSVIQVPET